MKNIRPNPDHPPLSLYVKRANEPKTARVNDDEVGFNGLEFSTAILSLCKPDLSRS